MGKLQDMRTAKPYFVVDLLDIIYKGDPTPTKKYFNYMVNVSDDFIKHKFIENVKTKTFGHLFNLIEKFEQYKDYPVIKEKDIYHYSLEELISTINEAKEYKSKAVIRDMETLHLYKDDRFEIVAPMTFASSCMYGAGTTWCTTSTDTTYDNEPRGLSYFNNHISQGVLLYVIDKAEKGRKFHRLAWYVDVGKTKKYSNEFSIWDAQDHKIDGFSDQHKILYGQLTEPVRDKILKIIAYILEKKYTMHRHATELKNELANV